MHVSTLLLGDMSLGTMYSLHMFPERAGVCVTLGAAGDFAYIGFLSNATKKWNCRRMVYKSDYDLVVVHYHSTSFKTTSRAFRHLSGLTT